MTPSTILISGNALVTGASRGIGARIALSLSRAGAGVAIGFARNLAEAENVRSQCGGKAVLVQGDLSNPADCLRFFERAESDLGEIDILVNNAAIYERDTFGCSYHDWVTRWERVVATNLLGPANLTYCAVQAMKRRGRGRIINIASRSAFRGETEYLSYAATKGALVALTRSVARASAGDGIVAFAVAPGFIEAGMALDEIRNRGDEIRAQIPSGRIGSAEDVANVVVFLASGLADYCTGTTIDVNGASYVR